MWVVPCMAKTETFFIRKTVDIGNDNAFYQDSIDLGSFVNALEKSVLRIHSITASISDSTGRSNTIAADSAGAAQWQLTTQTKGDVVLPSDRSVISTGKLLVNNSNAAAGLATGVSHDFDVLPQTWSQGYLVATDVIYLGGAASTAFTGDAYVSLILECTVETMSQADAMSLALSQQ